VYALFGGITDRLHSGNNTIAPSDLDGVEKMLADPTNNLLASKVSRGMQMINDRLRSANLNLWGESNDPKIAVTGAAVGQGFLGDCWAMAPISTVADHMPGTIPEMIKQNGNQFTVTFPKDGVQPVTVDFPTDTELALFAAGSKSGIWVPVLEKALSKYFNDKYLEKLFDVDSSKSVVISAFNQFMKNADFSRAVIDGGIPARALELLTGKKVVTLDTSSPNIVTAMRSAQEWGLAMEAGSRHMFSDSDRDENSVLYRHSYSVGALTDNEVTVRNPQGAHSQRNSPLDYGAEREDGTLTLPWGRFLQSFNTVDIVVP
jgi:hypothetical protein